MNGTERKLVDIVGHVPIEIVSDQEHILGLSKAKLENLRDWIKISALVRYKIKEDKLQLHDYTIEDSLIPANDEDPVQESLRSLRLVFG